MLNILIDADVLIFRGSLAGENRTVWEPAYIDGNGEIHPALEEVTLDMEKAKASVDFKAKSIVGKVKKHLAYKGECNVVMALSDAVNFRKQLYPAYKMNRADKPKPQLYKELRAYVEGKYNCEYRPNFEGDDILGVLATSLENTVVCSIDKDMATIPNTIFYNIDKETFLQTTPESALYAHLYQTLIGDSVDNYKGCPGIGPKKAVKALDEDCSWENVISIFATKGLTEEDALLQARVAKILTADLVSDDGNIIMWSPYAHRGNLMINEVIAQ